MLVFGTGISGKSFSQSGESPQKKIPRAEKIRDAWVVLLCGKPIVHLGQ